jgi:four helix bundle protein
MNETENIMSMQRISHGADGETKPQFDLEERTAVFGERVIKLAKVIPVNPVNETLIKQFVRAGTSVGANYGEANDAESKKDFRHKIGICRKESKESKYWLRMLAVAEPSLRDKAADLWQEAKELNLIFGAIRRSCERRA